MRKEGWLVILFIVLVVIVAVVVIVIAFDRIPLGPTGPFGPTGQTGATGQTGTSPCGNATVFDQLCLLNGTVITLTNTQTDGLLGICQGSVLNEPNWCVDTGDINFCATFPNIPDSTSWQVLRSTNNQFIAFLNTITNEYLNTNRFWANCSPCTYGLGCNNPVSTYRTSLNPNNPGADNGSWFTINIVDLSTQTIQILPSTRVGYVGADPSQMNSNSCANMVVANYTQNNPATNWMITYLS